MHRIAGFGLVELLVALVVMALLAAVALPWYGQYSQRTYRREAQADLLRCAQALEIRANETFTYANAADGDGDGVGDADDGPVASSLCQASSPDRYRIFVSATRADFTLRAKPRGPMQGDGDLSFDAAGNRSWDRNADGRFGGAGENSWLE